MFVVMLAVVSFLVLAGSAVAEIEAWRYERRARPARDNDRFTRTFTSIASRDYYAYGMIAVGYRVTSQRTRRDWLRRWRYDIELTRVRPMRVSITTADEAHDWPNQPIPFRGRKG